MIMMTWLEGRADTKSLKDSGPAVVVDKQNTCERRLDNDTIIQVKIQCLSCESKWLIISSPQSAPRVLISECLEALFTEMLSHMHRNIMFY